MLAEECKGEGGHRGLVQGWGGQGGGGGGESFMCTPLQPAPHSNIAAYSQREPHLTGHFQNLHSRKNELPSFRTAKFPHFCRFFSSAL